MKKAQIFIRNDDAWTLDEPFQFFFDQMMIREIPVVYAVIPGKMEADFVSFLCSARKQYPRLINIVQHGWMHVNHSGGEIRKYEFGPSRTLEQQGRDIDSGLKRMRAAFGDDFLPAFVPPFHGFDENTVRLVNEREFRVFSAGGAGLGNSSALLEFPAGISFSRYDRGTVKLNTAREMLEMMLKCLTRSSLSGILTHHSDFVTDRSRQELIRFFDVLKKLESRGEAEILLFSDILSHDKKFKNTESRS